MKKTLAPLMLLLGCLVAVESCSTNVTGDDAAPVFLQGSFTLLPLEKNVADGVPLQFQTTTLNNKLKVTGISPTTFLDVQVDDYVVVWTRIDGGKTASQPQVFGGNVSVPAGGTSSLNNYPYMSADPLLRPPLDQLFPFNGGIDRETGRAEIRQEGCVTWRGHTLSGQPVTTPVPACFDMIFVHQALARAQGARLR